MLRLSSCIHHDSIHSDHIGQATHIGTGCGISAPA
jgi:hypothetical protein